METWSLTIPDLIHFVRKDKSLALPEFQRNWEWDADDVAEMLRTVIANWPSGSILVMAIQNEDLKFELRKLRDAPDLNKEKVKWAVLDGQQRLTSVYRACTGVAGETYYVDMNRIAKIHGFDDDCLSYMKNEDFEAEYGNRQDRATRGIVKVEELYSESLFNDWRHELPDSKSDEMDDLFDAYLSGLRRYKFPVLQLPDDLDLRALVRIFDKLNRLGEKLERFDLMVARLLLAKEKFRLRDQWDEAKKVYPELFVPYRIDGMEVLRLIALREHVEQAAERERDSTYEISIKGVREDDVLDVDVDVIASSWDSAVDDLAAALNFIKARCGVVHRALLPSATMLLPLALGISLSGKADTRAGFKDDLETWYWSSVFRQTYAQGANTRAVTDAKALRQWRHAENAEPEAVKYFRTKANVDGLDLLLRDRRSRNNHFLRGTMSLFVRNGARDWRSRDGAAPIVLREHTGAFQFHHIFPQEWLENRGKVTDPLVDFAVLTGSTNASLGKDAPSTIFERDDVVVDAISDHRVDIDSLKTDNWEAFSEKRAVALLEMIRAVLPSIS